MGKVTKFPNKNKKMSNTQTSNDERSNVGTGSNKMKHKIVSLVLLVTTAYFAFLMVDQGVKYAQLMERRDELEQEITEAKETQEQLEQEVELLKDPEYLEILARRKFGFINEDQKLLELPEED